MIKKISIPESELEKTVEQYLESDYKLLGFSYTGSNIFPEDNDPEGAESEVMLLFKKTEKQ